MACLLGAAIALPAAAADQLVDIDALKARLSENYGLADPDLQTLSIVGTAQSGEQQFNFDLRLDPASQFRSPLFYPIPPEACKTNEPQIGSLYIEGGFVVRWCEYRASSSVDVKKNYRTNVANGDTGLILTLIFDCRVSGDYASMPPPVKHWCDSH